MNRCLNWFLSDCIAPRCHRCKLDFVEHGHFVWEDAADEYAAIVTAWWDGGYAAAGRAR